MKIKNYIFCALDFSHLNETIEFTSLIKNYVGGVKLGLEFFMNNGPEGVKTIKKIGVPIFLDLKLHDIPNTVKKAAENVIKLNPEYLTVHLNGGKRMIEEIVSIKKNTKIIGVSMLTSLDEKDLKSFGLKITEKKYIQRLTEIGIDAGIDGVVTSPLEVEMLKNKVQKKFLFVTPGIRLPENNKNDQKRIATPGEAIKFGSSMLVIGRSITASKNPIKSIEMILKNIEDHIEGKN